MHPNERRVPSFMDMWECRAEGTLKNGQRAGCAIAVNEMVMRSAVDQKGYRAAAERQVLVKYFHDFDQVPYRIYWVRNGREWLEPVARNDLWTEDGATPTVEVHLRDTRDHTNDREDS